MRRGRSSCLASVVVALGGCNWVLGMHQFDPTQGIDAPTVVPDAPLGSSCYGAPWRVCFTTPPAGTVYLSGDFTTTTSPECTAYTGSTEIGDACVIAGQTISIAAPVVVTGSRPLVLVAADGITFDNQLDVSSRTMSDQEGPGADPAVCQAGQPATTQTTYGGGAGGSFTGHGGSGGLGGIGGNGATAGSSISASSLHGGCPGSEAAGQPGRGTGGHGGGALLLIASTITINDSGMVDVSGGGGPGFIAGAGGGGGGGAGGMIVLEAMTVTFSGSGGIWANGGGGGEGAMGQAGGMPGQESLYPTIPASGGAGGGDNSGDGGQGSVGSSLDGEGGGAAVFNTGAAGGGGGGGAGAIIIRAINFSEGNISPPAT